MNTQIFTALDLKEAALLLKQGELIAFPTETVYGLGACVFNEEAIAKIFKAKKRPTDNPLIVHISAVEEVLPLGYNIPKAFYKLAEAFFPGPLTLVLERSPNVSSLISGGLPTVAVRMPNHPLGLKLIELVGEPLVAPSANLSGKPSSTELEHVLEDFDGSIAGVVDGGACSIGIESTVVSLIQDKPVILRPGAITASEISSVLGEEIGFFNKQDGILQASPGMKYRHYAPQAAVKLFFHCEEFQEYISIKPKKRLIIDAPSQQTLYGLLRKADRENYEEIVIYCDATCAADRGLMDRLMRASGMH